MRLNAQFINGELAKFGETASFDRLKIGGMSEHLKTEWTEQTSWTEVEFLCSVRTSLGLDDGLGNC